MKYTTIWRIVLNNGNTFDGKAPALANLTVNMLNIKATLKGNEKYINDLHKSNETLMVNLEKLEQELKELEDLDLTDKSA